MTRTQRRLTVPEAARRLGIPGEAVYQLVFEGRLEARPGSDGAVYVSSPSLKGLLSEASQDAAGTSRQ